MATYVTTPYTVYHMEMDEYIDGSILFSDPVSLTTTDGNTSQIVAGGLLGRAYREGVGKAATFYGISGFHQVSSRKVIVADMSNHCLRLVDRLTGQTSPFSGSCTKGGYADGSQGLFNRPYSIISDNGSQGKLLVTDHNNRAVRQVDINTRVVSTFYGSMRLLNDLAGITQEISSSDLYLMTSTALYQLHYQTKQLKLIAGSPITNQIGYRDGDFSVSLFNSAREILLIENGKKILVADANNGRLRVVDKESATTYSICTGTSGHKDGDLEQCELSAPLSLLVSGDSLYIGENNSIRRIGM